MRTLILTAGLVLAAAPALADAQMLGIMARGTGVGSFPLARGYAVCMLGGGTVEGVVNALAAARLTATQADEDEMGMVGFSIEGMPFTIALYDDGAICDVTSETIDAGQAMQSLMIIAGTTGFQMEDGNCPVLRLGGTVSAALTSSGNDPVCPPADTSNVRFSFAPAPAAAAPAPTK